MHISFTLGKVKVMEMFIGIFYIVVAVYLVGCGLTMYTKNFRSALMFKIIPVTLGLVVIQLS